MKRRILLVDDELAVLLTLKAVLEINGFDVDTAASAREGKLKLRSNEYNMVISDMRMESNRAGEEVLEAARNAEYHPAIALLTAYPLSEEDWQEMGADKMLVKPMHTRILLQQVESLLAAHELNLANEGAPSRSLAVVPSSGTKKTRVGKTPGKTAKKNSEKLTAAGKTAKKPVKSVISKKVALKAIRKKTRRG